MHRLVSNLQFTVFLLFFPSFLQPVKLQMSRNILSDLICEHILGIFQGFK